MSRGLAVTNDFQYLDKRLNTDSVADTPSYHKLHAAVEGASPVARKERSPRLAALAARLQWAEPPIQGDEISVLDSDSEESLGFVQW